MEYKDNILDVECGFPSNARSVASSGEAVKNTAPSLDNGKFPLLSVIV